MSATAFQRMRREQAKKNDPINTYTGLNRKDLIELAKDLDGFNKKMNKNKLIGLLNKTR